ncbi:MAG: hypothetical protein ACOYNR_08340 [Blastocatellia bacterium]
MSQSRLFSLLLLTLGSVLPLGAQVPHPYLTTISPVGGSRGQTVTVMIEGVNLSGATAILFDKPGVSGQIILNAETTRTAPGPSTDPTRRFEGDRAVRNRLQVKVTIDPAASPGEYQLRLVTPLGTSSANPFLVGVLPETLEREENDQPSTAQPLTLPTTVVGEMQTVGDRDHFRFNARTGQELVFEVVASVFGSRLDAVLTLTDQTGQALATSATARGRRDALLAHRFAESGLYTLQVTDYEQRGMGKPNEFGYRLNIGELPVITGWFPLGLRQGTNATIALRGHNLPTRQLKLDAPVHDDWSPVVSYRPDRPKQMADLPIDEIRLPLGTTPEIMATATANSRAMAQTVAWPVTINGQLDATPEAWYRFRARRGQSLTLEVIAERFGSPLDSVIEVYDSRGQLVPRALLRCVFETTQTLNDRDSRSRGIRLLSWNGLQPEDYLLIGNELLQIEVLPKGPDEDVFFKNVSGQRIGFLDTTPEAHAVNTPIYKVSIHPPEAVLPPNGMPQVKLYYRNDDGGPMYGKDSRLAFTAPADGEYLVRLRDVRGWKGETFGYRLAIREPRPDFSLTVDPENPNLPPDTAVPIHVTAFRSEGMEEEIEVALRDLPPGYTATTGIIRAGMDRVTLLLRAPANAPGGFSFPLHLEGTAIVAGRRLVRVPPLRGPLAVVTVTSPPELTVATAESRVELAPGGSAWVTLRVQRQRGFQGRIPFDIRNLPHGVIVRDVGLNGVLITEDETTQRFELYAEPWTRPVTQPVIPIGRIETASPLRSEFPARPFQLVIQ